MRARSDCQCILTQRCVGIVFFILSGVCGASSSSGENIAAIPRLSSTSQAEFLFVNGATGGQPKPGFATLIKFFNGNQAGQVKQNVTRLLRDGTGWPRNYHFVRPNNVISSRNTQHENETEREILGLGIWSQRHLLAVGKASAPSLDWTEDKSYIGTEKHTGQIYHLDDSSRNKDFLYSQDRKKEHLASKNRQIFNSHLIRKRNATPRVIADRKVNNIKDGKKVVDVKDRSSDGSTEASGVNEESWNDYIDKLFDPDFDTSIQTNISAVEGQTVHMGCRVNNLGTKTVSWIRHADTHILTVGSSTYTSDHRFSTLHRQGTNEWTLQLRDPTKKDAGLYECQVSTKPVRAHVVHLSVVVPSAAILHAPELYIDEGSGLNLTCVVSPSPRPPEYIFWYHRGEVINYETDRRVTVTVQQRGMDTVCSLVVQKASLDHSGRYQCAPSNAEPADIVVHIFKGDSLEILSLVLD